jgi:formamidopyrimidine-DNA glycosylase
VPELPDIQVYIEALAVRIAGRQLERIRIARPFFLRSVEPPIEAASGQRVAGVERFGKRIVIALEGDRFLVVHLMIAGRLHWKAPGAPVPKGNGLAAIDFANGSLIITESGSKKRASLHLVASRAALAAIDRGGIDVLAATTAQFTAALHAENHTLKRTLTDPRLFSGIGNAYSDEILHAARLSPLQLTRNLGDQEIARLLEATREVLVAWTERLRVEAKGEFPEKVTAFRDGMGVHGRFGKPCPVCGAPVQRVVYAENEANYCARCQTGGRLLADRALSRLLGQDWPRRLEE